MQHFVRQARSQPEKLSISVVEGGSLRIKPNDSEKSHEVININKHTIRPIQSIYVLLAAEFEAVEPLLVHPPPRFSAIAKPLGWNFPIVPITIADFGNDLALTTY